MPVAAELRVAGLSWESISQRVQRSLETCQHLCRRYAEYWQQLYLAAET